MNSLNRELTVLIDGAEISQGCRVHLYGEGALSLYPNLWIVSLCNLSDQARNRLRVGGALSVTSGGSELAAGLVRDVSRKQIRREVFPRGISADHASHGRCTVNWREPAASAQVYRAVQCTVVPGNWMGGRQSDSSIVLMMKGNAFGRRELWVAIFPEETCSDTQ